MKRFAVLAGAVAVALLVFSASTTAKQPAAMAYDAFGPQEGLLTFVNAEGRHVEVLDRDFCVVFADRIPGDVFQVMVPHAGEDCEGVILRAWMGGPVPLSVSTDNNDFVWE